MTPDHATTATASNGQVGNLELTAEQEADLVNFLSILSDGFTNRTLSPREVRLTI